MLTPSTVEKLLPILKKYAARSLKMRVPGFPNPYFCSLLLRDIDLFHTSARSGSTFRKFHDKNRKVFCDLRVGSYKYDQVTNGGLEDSSEEEDSYNHIELPIDDISLEGTEKTFEKLVDTKFREALASYKYREALRVSFADSNANVPSFIPLLPHKHVDKALTEKVDHNRWIKFCKTVSAWIASISVVSDSHVEFESEQETKIFVSTEKSIIVQHKHLFSFNVTITVTLKDGSSLTQDIVFNTSLLKELPDLRAVKNHIESKLERMMLVLRSQCIPSFSGPALLLSGPAGLLFHEAVGHRLEGSRLLSSSEGQTFKGQLGKRLFGVDISVKDDPTIKQFKGKSCIGGYRYDDEGTPGSEVTLVEHGVLKNYLNTRAPLSKKDYIPNGHARSKSHERPISRMAVLVVEGKNKYSFEHLKEILLREINKQKKPFGLIIYEAQGGETETQGVDFQGFHGEISYATVMYPDGKEEVVRGLSFYGTPLQSLQNVIAVGNTYKMENHFCGAESGFIPVTTIAPPVLLRSLELHSRDDEQ